MGKAFILCFLSICVFYCTRPASLSNITPVRYESEKTWERMLTGLRVQTNETEETTDTPKLINSFGNQAVQRVKRLVTTTFENPHMEVVRSRTPILDKRYFESVFIGSTTHGNRDIVSHTMTITPIRESRSLHKNIQGEDLENFQMLDCTQQIKSTTTVRPMSLYYMFRKMFVRDQQLEVGSDKTVAAAKQND